MPNDRGPEWTSVVDLLVLAALVVVVVWGGAEVAGFVLMRAHEARLMELSR